MAIINSGSITDFSVELKERAGEPITALSEAASADIEQTSHFTTSADKRGLTLESLSMTEEFNGFFGRLFNVQSEFYCIAWTWDMKGVHFFPGQDVDPKTCLIPLTPKKNERRFIGDGALLFPPRQVSAGIAVRIQVWESKQDAREVGALIKKVGEVLSNSELSLVIATAAAAATGGALASIQLAQKAAATVAQEIGGVLADTPDQLVDYFEGYYSAAGTWPQESDSHSGVGSEIVLNKIV